MKTRSKNQNGFTLIEIIVSLMIFGLIASFTVIGISNVMEGYIFTKDNSNTSLKTQIALTRLTKEFGSIDSVLSGSDTSITYTIIKNGSQTTNRTVTWSGTQNDPLTLDNNILIDNVNDFTLTYHTSYSDTGDSTWNGAEKIIGIRLDVSGASNIISSFSTRVAPRNL